MVYNNITQQFREANVSVYDNHGYHVEGSTTNGIYWTPTNITDGNYNIKVRPDDDPEADPGDP